jgi:hypothetical protein
MTCAESGGRSEPGAGQFFYEIRSSDNSALKRDGGFPTQDGARIAGREDQKKR